MQEVPFHESGIGCLTKTAEVGAMPIRNLAIRARTSIEMDGFELYMYATVPGNDDLVSVVTNIEFTTVSRFTTRPDGERIYVQRTALQKLMDDLWSEGLRPTDYKDTREVLTAMKEHINDLRKVQTVFLELPRPVLAPQSLLRRTRVTE
jgi:hypothetical protein